MGRFTQPDPIGLAGGHNQYGFAAGDPVNSGDPFGLCPYEEVAGKPRDSNVENCPDDERKNAFKLIATSGSSEAKETMQAFIDKKLSFDLVPKPFGCQHSSNVTACRDGSTMRLSATALDGSVRGSAAMASDLVHEVTHVIHPNSNQGLGELRAWDRALNFYERLGTLRVDTEYNTMMELRKDDRGTYRVRICRSVGGC